MHLLDEVHLSDWLQRLSDLTVSREALEPLIFQLAVILAAILLDRAIGYQASGITMAMFEIGPGRGQSMHRHPGEAWLYVVEGSGHSYLGTEPEGGTDHQDACRPRRPATASARS